MQEMRWIFRGTWRALSWTIIHLLQNDGQQEAGVSKWKNTPPVNIEEICDFLFHQLGRKEHYTRIPCENAEILVLKPHKINVMTGSVLHKSRKLIVHLGTFLFPHTSKIEHVGISNWYWNANNSRWSEIVWLSICKLWANNA